MYLFLIVAALAFAAGFRRSMYDGIPPVIWWRQQRLYRRPRQIIGRLAKVVLGVALLIASVVVALMLLGVVLAAVLLACLLAGLWWKLRSAARAAAPHLYPAERDDVEPPELAEPMIWPPGAIPDPEDPEDPHNPRALEW
ncbi:hypothetical protein GCM10023075_81080 [Streptosporangium album]